MPPIEDDDGSLRRETAHEIGAVRSRRAGSGPRVEQKTMEALRPFTITLPGFPIAPLPDLATASLAELREAELSDRELLGFTDGAWQICQCCGAFKIDGKGHKPGCAMAVVLAAREGDG